MATAAYDISPRTQVFKSSDGTPLAGLPAYTCENTGSHFLLWSDIEQVFEGLYCLQHSTKNRAMFMTDEFGELFQPLRIEHDNQPFTVIYMDSQWHSQDQGQDQDQDQEHDQMMKDLLMPLERIFYSCVELYRDMEFAVTYPKYVYLQARACNRFYRNLLLLELETLHEMGFEPRLPSLNESQIMDHIDQLEERVTEWDFTNNCSCLLLDEDCKWDSPGPRLFIVLPANLSTWDDADEDTHQFRLHFLCDIGKKPESFDGAQLHVHISNHDGYSLQRPRQFFKIYGDYVFQVLKMVKRGYSDENKEVPSLDSLQIMWGWYSNHMARTQARDSIVSLVEKSIFYLEALDPPKMGSRLALTKVERAEIKTYLNMPGVSDMGHGNLHRYITASQNIMWICQPHIRRFQNTECLQQLRTFVRTLGGHLDMALSTLRIGLQSPDQANRFLTALVAPGIILDLTVSFNWYSPSRQFLKHFVRSVAQTRAVVLDVAGLTGDTYLQSNALYQDDLFATLVQDSTLQLITLLDYPCPQEKVVYTAHGSIQSALLPSRKEYNWVDLGNDIRIFKDMLEKAQTSDEIQSTVIAFSSTLARKHAQQEATKVTFQSKGWSGTFDLVRRAFVECTILETGYPEAINTSESIEKLTADLTDEALERNIHYLVPTNLQLQEVAIFSNDRDRLLHAFHIAWFWRHYVRQLNVVLLDRMQEGSQGRVLARLSVCGRHINSITKICDIDPEEDKDNILGVEQDPREENTSVDIEFEEWNCDHVYSLKSDYSCWMLELATQKHPTRLTAFTLNVSQLSCGGLDQLEVVLGRSQVEHLHIICNSFESQQADSIAQILLSVPWSTLISLSLSGWKINEWAENWAVITEEYDEDPKLSRLHLCGTGSTPLQLSHATVLFLHRLLYSSPLLEFKMENLELEVLSDWVLIVDIMNPELLRTIDFCENSQNQFRSSQSAWELFVSKYEVDGDDDDDDDYEDEDEQ
ncbi:hypothetical protein BG004_006521, partial [Podila humilis]